MTKHIRQVNEKVKNAENNVDAILFMYVKLDKTSKIYEHIHIHSIQKVVEIGDLSD